jgi:hypothetical protein
LGDAIDDTMGAMSRSTLVNQGDTPRFSRRRRRWPLIAILAVAVAVTGGMLVTWWFLWVPN